MIVTNGVIFIKHMKDTVITVEAKLGEFYDDSSIS